MLAGTPEGAGCLQELLRKPDGFRDKTPLRELLFEKMMERAVEINNNASVRDTKICFCHFSSETESIDHALSKGFKLSDGIYNMTRDLGEPVVEAAVPEGLQIIEWRMGTTAEKARYIEAYNTVFPEKPWSVEGLDYFMQSDM